MEGDKQRGEQELPGLSPANPVPPTALDRPHFGGIWGSLRAKPLVPSGLQCLPLGSLSAWRCPEAHPCLKLS